MPSWKKVITSGSAAALNSLTVSNGITGSLFGTASYATQALSASYAPSAGLTGGTANYIPLWTSTSAISSSAIYQSAGNVGIGTTSPAEKLSIAGNIELTIGVNRYVKIGSATNYFYNLQSVNDNFQILEAGTTPRLTITYPNGNVGIGTTSPNAKLDVSGSLNISGSGVQVPLQVYSGSTPLLFVSQSGKVGIGTSTFVGSIKLAVNGQIGGPTYSSTYLDVTGDTAQLRGNSGIGFYAASSDHIFYGASSVERARITNAGNVGIGTTSPNAKLDVNGNAIITGSLQISSSIFQYSNNAAILSGSTANIASFATSSYMAGFFDYVASSNGNARAGTVFTVWNGNSLEFTETSTNDIGSTTNLVLSASLLAGAVRLQGTSLSGSWNVKTLTRMI